jgi:alkylation response protein AidB-like acyl-CoA dehydrogenase
MAVLSAEQEMLRDSAVGWARERAPLKALRSVRTTYADTGHDPALYAEMAEMGWTGVVVPEDFGGFAFGYQSFGLVLEQLGRTLAVSPLLSSALVATSALVMGGSDAQKRRWLPGIVDGSIIGTIALEEGARHGDGWRLSGTKRPVLDGLAATLMVVVARTSGERGEHDGITLFLCPAATPGITRTPLRQIDSRGDAIVTLDGVELGPDAVLGEVDQGFALLERVLDRARGAMASEMLGASVQAFETTVDYLKTRVQFGAPIGSFQALQHRAADMVAEIELTRSAVEAALAAIDADGDDVPALASLAKALAGRTMRSVAREMVQMHGGIGMTDEHDAGLYLKRAHAADVAYGNAAYHRERYGLLAGY